VTKHPSPNHGAIKITNQLLDKDAAACSHFVGRYFRNITNRPSPAWLQNRLKSIELRPISALVDITNYITFDLGRPLHVFDAQLVKDQHLIIRTAKDGETLMALDGKTYTLDHTMTVVADPDNVLALGGIIGGQASGCQEHTHEVILECAYFDPIRIAKTGRQLDVRTDSRYRLERGVDPQSTWLGIEMATQMILDICGGEVVQTVEVGKPIPVFAALPFTPTLVGKIAGLEIKEDLQKQILMDLGFDVKVNAKGPWTVTPPTWRHDVTIPMDLVEEVLRVHGYDNIPTPAPHASLNTHSPLTLFQQRVHQARYALAHRSLQEAVTWSMINHSLIHLFGGDHENLRISNPISLDLEYLRPSILPTLLLATQRNQERTQSDVNLFEVGPQYFGGKPGEQHTVAAIVRTGVHNRNHWSHTDRPVDIYNVKADVLDVLEVYGVHADQVQYQTQNLPSWYHPGRSASIQQGPKNRLALFGELHPAIVKQMGLKGRIMIAEIFLDKLPLKKVAKKDIPLHLSAFQPVERDFSFLVDIDMPADRIIQAVKKKHKQLITAVHVFDVFQNASLVDKKALGIRIRLEPHLGTLTDEEIKAVSQDIVDAVTQLGGSLR
jgi:phenylalanyl-tRNA synthetase beta chain